MSSLNTYTNSRNLVHTLTPEKPWEHLVADHWGPTPDGKHVLVVLDKYPEVSIVNSTSSEANVEAFDDIFARHGFCKRIKTDRGPPFNGCDSHQLQQYFKWAGIQHKTTTSAEDPEANGLTESFMKHLQKIWHTSTVNKKHPKAEINKHLRMYRATPHPSTGKHPAELLFNRPFNSRLPNFQLQGTQQNRNRYKRGNGK